MWPSSTVSGTLKLATTPNSPPPCKPRAISSTANFRSLAKQCKNAVSPDPTRAHFLEPVSARPGWCCMPYLSHNLASVLDVGHALELVIKLVSSSTKHIPGWYRTSYSGRMANMQVSISSMPEPQPAVLGPASGRRPDCSRRIKVVSARSEYAALFANHTLLKLEALYSTSLSCPRLGDVLGRPSQMSTA